MYSRCFFRALKTSIRRMRTLYPKIIFAESPPLPPHGTACARGPAQWNQPERVSMQLL
ncbi:hypothetical protein B0H10DRAFT_2044307, partial [Mycena sp. CBHHK59/15]